MSSSAARKEFKRFVKKWNGGELPTRFYAQVEATAQAAAARTRHRWAFADKLSKEDQWALDTTKDGVNSQTEKAPPQSRYW